MREILMNSAMVIWGLALCWMWANVIIFNKEDEDYTAGTCVVTVAWWIVVIWFL